MLEREAIERIMDGVPRLERAPGVGLRVVAAAERAAAAAGAGADRGCRRSRSEGGAGRL